MVADVAKCALRFIRPAGPLVILAAAWLCPPAHAQHPCDLTPNDYVKVVVDMDPTLPGCQSNIVVQAGTTIVEDVAVTIFDPLQRPMWAVGYLGGLDRGIAFGHTPSSDCRHGQVVDMAGTAQTAVHPGNVPMLTPFFEKSFAGPEVQYVEFGAGTPAAIAANPPGPVFTVDILLENAQPGDVFDFYIGDHVVIWTGGSNGAFSTQGPWSLDSGGDAVPDLTVSVHGIDADTPIPVPPAAFLVDYIDGGIDDGPATITVYARRGDHNRDGNVDLNDIPGFVDVLLGVQLDPNQVGLADMNCDHRADAADVGPFLGLLVGGP